MPWIRQVAPGEPDDHSGGELGEIWQAATERAGGVANIIRLMSLDARVCSASMGFYLAAMKQSAVLSRARREMIATVVSNVNDCWY